MNWEAIGAVGEMLGAVGVIVTLVYFGLQIRRYSQQMQIQNLRGQAAEMQRDAIFQASPHMLDVLEKCYSHDSVDFTFQEKTLLESYFQVSFATIGADYQLYVEGLLSKKAWQQRIFQAVMLLSSTWMQQYWNQIKDVGDSNLVSMIDEALASHDPGEYLRFMETSGPAGGRSDA